MKRLFQARLLRKKNPDSHYANDVYSFLKERAVEHVTSTAMISADAKYKVSVGELEISVRENLSCSSKIELPYYSVDFSGK